MARRRSYRVQELALIAGVSVRALHHYDEVGLLVPKVRTSAGYRLYHDDDLLRLQQILIGRELGLALEEIRRSLDDPQFDRKQALLEQKRYLQERAQRTDAMLRALDAALSALENENENENENEGEGTMDMKRIFDGFDPAKYEQETEQRWGDTSSYEESAKRTKRYTKDDWQRLRAEQDAIYSALAAAQHAGKAPSDDDVMDIAERHRSSIDRWFYPCSLARHAALADMYESDPRFSENIDKYGAGLTPFLSAAIRHNQRRPPS